MTINHEQIRELLAQLIELPPKEKETRLEEIQNESPELFDELQSLFLSPKAIETILTTTHSLESALVTLLSKRALEVAAWVACILQDRKILIEMLH